MMPIFLYFFGIFFAIQGGQANINIPGSQPPVRPMNLVRPSTSGAATPASGPRPTVNNANAGQANISASSGQAPQQYAGWANLGANAAAKPKPQPPRDNVELKKLILAEVKKPGKSMSNN